VYRSLECKREDNKKAGALTGVSGPVKYLSTSFKQTKNPSSHSQNWTDQRADAFEDTAFKLGFEIAKFWT
jgi:hypothetical protein